MSGIVPGDPLMRLVRQDYNQSTPIINTREWHKRGTELIYDNYHNSTVFKIFSIDSIRSLLKHALRLLRPLKRPGVLPPQIPTRAGRL